MPTIHVIFDPKDKIAMPRAEDLKRMGVSAGAMVINTEEIEIETIQDTAEKLTALLLNAIARDQQ